MSRVYTVQLDTVKEYIHGTTRHGKRVYTVQLDTVQLDTVKLLGVVGTTSTMKKSVQRSVIKVKVISGLVQTIN